MLKLDRSVPEEAVAMKDPTSQTIGATASTNFTRIAIQQSNKKQKRYPSICLICVQLIHLRRSKTGCLRGSQGHPYILQFLRARSPPNVFGASLLPLHMYSMHDNKHLHLERIARRYTHIAPRCLFLDTVTAEFKSFNTQKLAGAMATIL